MKTKSITEMRFTGNNLATSFIISFIACVCLLFGAGAHTRLHAQEGKTPQATPPAVNTPADTARGIELYKQGQNREAAGVLRAVVKRRKDDAQAWLHLGIALTRAGESKDARKAFEKAMKLSPDTPQAHIGMAYILLESGKVEDAQREAERALALDARNAESHYALGLIHLRKGHPGQALAEAETTLKLNPNFAGALLLKVEAAKEAYAVAIFERHERYRKLNQPVPDVTPEERAIFGNFLKEASAALEKFLAQFPASPDAARLRQEAETLRVHSEWVGKSDEPLVHKAGEVTTKAQILSKPEPLYTESARQKRVSGTIRLRMVLAFDGRVRNILVLTALPNGLTDMAVDAARRIKFRPATKDGRPVSQFVTIEYNFNVY
jgi:TonB family protein